MKCASCQKNILSQKSVPYSVVRKGYDVIFKDIPAFVCNSCGEVFFAEKSVAKIQEMISEIDQTAKEVQKEKIDFPFVQT